MDYDQFQYSDGRRVETPSQLSAADMGTIVQLMAELRELTLSRRSFEAATDLLRRFGGEIDSPMLVPADAR